MVLLKGIDTTQLKYMNLDNWKIPYIFFFNQIKKLSVLDIVDLVAVFIKKLLIQQQRSTFILFPIESQRYFLHKALTTKVNNLLEFWHGVIVCNEWDSYEGIGVKIIQPMIVAFMNKDHKNVL